MPVTYLELENFKSYAGHQIIGPFRDFTSIIGPNGSGKSNLMDAMSFVFGVQSRDLRSDKMKDLIYRPPGKLLGKNALKCSACLVYETPQGREIRFSRSISAAGAGEYHADGTTVNYEEYCAALEDIGVLVKARNFLVFQGDVESIARKTPAELTGMVENICGSAKLAAEYDEALQQKKDLEQSVLFAFKKTKGFRSERRLLKDQKEEAERFDALQQDKNTAQRDYYLWQLYHLDQDRQEKESVALELRDELQAAVDAEQELADALKETKKQASAARRVTGQADKKRVQLAAEVDQLEPSMIQTTEEIKNWKKKLGTDEKELTKKQQEAAQHGEKLEQLDTEIAEYQQTVGDLEKDYDEIKREAVGTDNVQLTVEQEEEYERVREAAAAASVKPRRVLTGLNRKLESARAKAAGITQDLADATAQRAEIAKDFKGFGDRETNLSNVCVQRDQVCVRIPLLLY
jgi:structural maintenance of chromosome 1